MKILALDQSLTSCGVAILVVKDRKLHIEQTQVITPKSTGIHRLVHFDNQFRALVNTHGPDLLVREMHHQRQFGAAAALQALGCITDFIAYQHRFLERNAYVTIPTTTWKKFCLGKGNLRKDSAYLLKVNKALRSMKMLVLPDDFEVLDDNISDAICLGITGYAAIAGVNPGFGTDAFDCLSKVTKSLFEYGSRG